MMSDIGEAAAVEVQPNLVSNESEKLVEMTEEADKLTAGLLETYQPALHQMKSELDELLKKQDGIVVKMSVENQQLLETAEDELCSQMYTTVKAYSEKLMKLKKEITTIHDRTTKLKKRAIRLQQAKEKEALNREQKRENDLRREQELIGKPTLNE